MRTALISDIHGNCAGLLSVLRDIAERNCHRIICLGDLVEGGLGNEDVVREIRTRGIPTVRGNHDEISDARLELSTMLYLNSLPEELVENDMIYTHISPGPKRRKVNDALNAWAVFAQTSYRRIFVGHAHIPLIFGEKSDEYGAATRHAYQNNRVFALDPHDRYIVCVGPIGYARDLAECLRYTIYDQSNDTVEIRTCEGELLDLDPDEDSPWGRYWKNFKKNI